MIVFNRIRIFLEYILSLIDPKLGETLPVLSGNKPEDFVRVAEAMCGKSGKDFGWRMDWCCFFVCWVSKKSRAFSMRAKAHPTSLTVEFLKRGNGEFYYFDDSTIDYLKKAFHSDFHTNFCQKSSRESFLPKKGDVILFLWKEHCEKYHMSHIGIVKEYKEGVIETIEGNTSDNMLVEKRMRNYDAQVIGFLRWNGQ